MAPPSARLTTVPSLIDGVIGREGGYVNDPRDKGGATIWGVTEQVARAYGYGGDMKAMPRDVAVSIYQKRFWTEAGLDGVNLIAPTIAAELFDIGVNMGVATGVAFLQRSLNVLNNGGQQYADIVVDNRCGALTLHALADFRQRRGDEGEERLLTAICALRGARYIEICESRPANEAFAYGWFGRMVAMARTLFPVPGR